MAGGGEQGLASERAVDLLVVGGGVNGTGIARDAAGRGLSVLLCEQDDLAAAHLVRQQQADPRRPALSRALRVPPRARGPDRARGAAARRPAHHLAAALRAAAQPRAAPGLDDPPRPVPLRPPRRARQAAGLEPASTSRTTRSARRSRTGSAPASPTPTAGSRTARLVVLNAMDAAERGAVILTRTRCAAAERAEPALAGDPAAARRQPARTVQARALINASGPWVSHLLTEQLGRAGAEEGAPGQGRPHRRAQALRPRLALHPAAHRRPRRLRDPLRAGILADRHHRQRLPGRSRRGRDHRRRDRLSVRGGEPLLQAAGHPGPGPLRLCRRPAALRRRHRRRLGGDPRLRLRSRQRAARRCSRCSAARSRPTASSPSMRSRSCSRCSASSAGPGRMRSRCRAATCRAPISSAFSTR